MRDQILQTKSTVPHLRRWAILPALASLLVLSGGAGVAHAASYAVSGSFGSAGTGAGQFGEFFTNHAVGGVAVDQSNGDVYVVDPFNARVQKFDPSGNFLYMFGWYVNTGGTEQFEVCTSSCEAGTSGSSPGQFNWGFGGRPVGVAVDPSTGYVYVVDSLNNRVEYFNGATGAYINEFNGTGAPAPPAPFNKPLGVAVDSSGHVYVADSGNQVVDKFSATGTYECQITGKTPGSASECNAGGSATLQEGFSLGSAYKGGDLAVDPSGNVYIDDDGNSKVDEFKSSGAYVQQYSAGEDSAIAVDSAGHLFAVVSSSHVQEFDPSVSLSTPVADFGAGTLSGTASLGIAVRNSTKEVYVGDSGSVASGHALWIFAPSALPAIESESTSNVKATLATLEAEVNPNGFDVSTTAPNECVFEYTTVEAFNASIQTAPCTPADLGSGEAGVTASAQVSGLSPVTTYYWRVHVANSGGATTGAATGTIEHFSTSGTPSIERESSSRVEQTQATLEAEINPNGADVSTTAPNECLFEYTTVEAFNASIQTAPCTPADLGSGRTGVSANAGLTGLEPNTTYYYRAAAKNSEGARQTDAIQEFRTLPPPPTVVTGEASSITAETATIAGTVNPGSTGPNSETSYFFEYREKGEPPQGLPGNFFGCNSPCFVVPSFPGGDAGQGTTDVSETASLTGLRPLETYHYRIAAYNGNGIFSGVYGAEGELTTPPLVPGVTTDVPVSVGTDTATVGGAIVAQGADTKYHVEYGTSEVFGASTPQADAGSARTGRYVTASLEGLQPDTKYYYRFVASNSGGEEKGKTAPFTTNATGEPGSGPLPAGFSLTGTAPSGAAALVYPNLTGLAPLSPPPTKATTPPKPLTNAQKLSKALKACKKDKSKSKRAKCEKQAHTKYGAKAKKKK